MQTRVRGREPRSTISVYDSASRPLPFWEELMEAWRYRDLVSQFLARDLKVRYKRSILGVTWTMLNPLALMLVLTLVFSHVFRIALPHYAVYVLSGMVLWNLFSQTTTVAMNQLVWGGPLLSRIYVPRTLFAVSAVGTGLVNLGIALVALALIMILTDVPFRSALIWVPAGILLTGLFALGMALLLSIVAVSFPDVIEMYQVALPAWYFLTPIMYPVSILSESARWWLNLNPMYHLVEVFRAPIYAGVPAGPHTVAAAAVAAVGMAIIGWVLFTTRADEIAFRV